MIATSATRADVAALSATAAFNRWAGFEVLDAGDGRAELKLPWRPISASTPASFTPR